MISINKIKEHIFNAFPDLGRPNEPLLQFLNRMQLNEEQNVLQRVSILRSNVFPVIKEEIHIGRAAAIYGVRDRSIDIILYGVISEIYQFETSDYRDTIVELTLLYSALKFMCNHPEDIIKKIMITLKKEEADFLMKYLSRPANLKTPECMGYRMVTSPEFSFERIIQNYK